MSPERATSFTVTSFCIAQPSDRSVGLARRLQGYHWDRATEPDPHPAVGMAAEVHSLRVFDPGPRPSTFKSCGIRNRLDYILLSRPRRAGCRWSIERHGLWGGPTNVNPNPVGDLPGDHRSRIRSFGPRSHICRYQHLNAVWQWRTGDRQGRCRAVRATRERSDRALSSLKVAALAGQSRRPGRRAAGPPGRGGRLGGAGSSRWAKGDLNPHPLAGTWPSTMRVCLFRHSPILQMQALVSCRRTTPST
jgi:hypothetical protein